MSYVFLNNDFLPNFFTVPMIYLKSLINPIKLSIYESKSHKIKKIDPFVNGECSSFTRPHA